MLTIFCPFWRRDVMLAIFQEDVAEKAAVAAEKAAAMAALAGEEIREENAKAETFERTAGTFCSKFREPTAFRSLGKRKRTSLAP